MTRLKGNDISRFQDDGTTPQHIDFYKMKSLSDFVIIRALFGTVPDRDFTRNFSGAKEAGLKVGIYVFLTHENVLAQFDALMKLTGGNFGDIVPTIDFEPYNYNGVMSVPSVSSLEVYSAQVQQVCNKYPMIYTGYYVWRDHGSTNAKWINYPLWIAAYTKEEWIQIPAPWKKCDVWQYTSKGDGIAHGTESLNIDMDWFMGESIEELLALGSYDTPIPPIDSPFTFTYKALNAMNVRSGPGTNYPVIGSISRGTEIRAEDFSGNDVWVKVANGRWVCKQKNGLVYLE